MRHIMPVSYTSIICLVGLLLRFQKALSEQFSYSIRKQTATNEEDEFTIEIDLKSKYCFLDLYRNKDLISEHYYEKYQTNETHFVINRPKAQEIELCHYIGKIRNVPNSWIAVTTCEGISGLMFDGKGIYAIDDIPPVNGSRVYSGEMKISSRDNITQSGFICDDGIMDLRRKTHRVKRDLFNESSYYVEVALVVDNSFYIAMNSNVTMVHRRCKDVINLVNSTIRYWLGKWPNMIFTSCVSLMQVYQTFNLFFAIVCIDVWTHGNKIDISRSAKITFQNFRFYAWSLLGHDHVDNVQLISHIQFAQKILGEGTLNGMCDPFRSFAINYDSIKNGIEEIGGVLAHEMAHNMGVHHDTEDCLCPDEYCIMWPSRSGSLKWSSCSYLEFEDIFENTNLLRCLNNKPVSAFVTQSCDQYYTGTNNMVYYIFIFNLIKWLALGYIIWICCLRPLMDFHYNDSPFIGHRGYPVYLQRILGFGNDDRTVQDEVECQHGQNDDGTQQQMNVESTQTATNESQQSDVPCVV